MFTGIVEELGTVRGIQRGANSIRIEIAAETVLADVKLGDSIAVNGVCLTVVDFAADRFTADVMPETMRKTSLHKLQPGDRINLERALRLGDRMGGHIVSGHVDGIGTIRRMERQDIAMIVTLSCPAALLRYIIPKGSITIDGISLTVVEVTGEGFSVSLIPHTAGMTTLGLKKAGDPVNLETDIIGKYVEKLLTGGQPSPGGIDMDYLRENGFL